MTITETERDYVYSKIQTFHDQVDWLRQNAVEVHKDSVVQIGNNLHYWAKLLHSGPVTALEFDEFLDSLKQPHKLLEKAVRDHRHKKRQQAMNGIRGYVGGPQNQVLKGL